MFCKEFENTGLLYFYNELSTEESRQFDQHLQTCEACRQALEELHTAVISYRSVTQESTAPIDIAKILPQSSSQFSTKQQIRNSLEVAFQYFRPPEWQYAMVAVVALALFCFLVLQNDINNQESNVLWSKETQSAMLAWDFDLNDSLNILDEKVSTLRGTYTTGATDSLNIHVSQDILDSSMIENRIALFDVQIQLLSQKFRYQTF